MLFFDKNKIVEDQLNILEHINTYSEKIGIKNLSINIDKLSLVLQTLYVNFPCQDGMAEANIFKKAAAFVATFIENSPLEKDAFEKSNISEKLRRLNANAIVAFDVAIRIMVQAKVIRSDEKVMYISNPIKLSAHSYIDILDMLSHSGLNIGQHFMCLSMLFEQMVYKTNEHLQYELIAFGIGQDEEVNTFDPGEVPVEWDDYIRVC